MIMRQDWQRLCRNARGVEVTESNLAVCYNQNTSSRPVKEQGNGASERGGRE